MTTKNTPRSTARYASSRLRLRRYFQSLRGHSGTLAQASDLALGGEAAYVTVSVTVFGEAGFPFATLIARIVTRSPET